MKRGAYLGVLLGLCAALDVALLVVPPGSAILDARFAYRPSDALLFLEALGPAGRHGYVLHQLVDLAFIATYTALFREIVRRLAVRPPRAVLYAPTVADLVETLGIITLIALYPSPPAALVWLVCVATPVKWISVIFVILTTVTLRLRR